MYLQNAFEKDVVVKMTNDLIKLPTNQLLDKFGSGGHKPGSGSAAALLGLVSCKLIQTVISLSSGRDAYKGVEAQLALTSSNVADTIEPILLKAVQDDSVQFDRVIAARRERDNEEDKKHRRHLADVALGELRTATEIPLDIAKNCIELAKSAMVVFDLGFRAARGDSGVAISAALSGASGCLSIIYLNLTSFRGGEWAADMRKKADELNEEVQKLQVELFSRIGRLQEEVKQRELQN